MKAPTVFSNDCMTVVFNPKSHELRCYAGDEEVFGIKEMEIRFRNEKVEFTASLNSHNKYMFKEESDKLKKII